MAGRRRRAAPTPPRLASMLSDADLLRTPLDDLTALARVVRDGAHGRRVTYSPKVFIPLTMLCRDRCGYCTFAKAPARVTAPYLTPRGGAGHRRGRAGRRVPRGPLHPGRAARAALPRGARLAGRRTATPRRWTTSPPCAASSWRRPACSPTPTPARSTPRELATLRPVSASQGMMLESLAEGLGGPPGRSRQGAGPAPGHPGGRRRAGHPLHHRHPGRHRRRPGRPAGRPARHRRLARPPRARAGGHRPELPAQAGHGHVPGRALPARGPAVGHRGGPAGAAARDPRAGAAEPLRRPGPAARRRHRRLGRRLAGHGRPREPRAGLAGARHPARGHRGGRPHPGAPPDRLPDLRPRPGALARPGAALPRARRLRRRGPGPRRVVVLGRRGAPAAAARRGGAAAPPAAAGGDRRAVPWPRCWPAWPWARRWARPRS